MTATRVWFLSAMLATGALMPASSSAQVADRIRQDRWHAERDHRYDNHHRGRAGRARGGPAFCRNGYGHPVHGPRWCVVKGFGLGGRYAHDPRLYHHRWHPRRYDRARTVVIIHVPAGRRHWDSGHRFDRAALRDVVGGEFYTQLSGHSRSLGYGDSLSGEWFEDDDGRVLTVFSGERPLAELVDRDRDGSAEDVRFLREP